MHCSARFWRDPFLQQEVRRSVHENHQSCIRRRQGKDHSVRELEIFPNKYSPFSYSREIGFLTGYESEIMEKAHLESVMIMGETLASDKPYDFAKTDMTTRIQQLVPVMLEHRQFFGIQLTLSNLQQINKNFYVCFQFLLLFRLASFSFKKFALTNNRSDLNLIYFSIHKFIL